MPPRLRQVLDRFLAGEAPARIARGMGLSVWTVREHLQRLYRQLGVNSREELMARFVGGSSGRDGEVAGAARVSGKGS